MPTTPAGGVTPTVPPSGNCEIRGCNLPAQVVQQHGVWNNATQQMEGADVKLCGVVHDLTVGMSIDLLPDRILNAQPAPHQRPAIRGPHN